MSGWTFAVAIFSQRIPLDIVARVLAIMGMVSVGFLLFILFTSNPFSRTLPNFPIEGRDLNPLLQDPGMIFHPPLLYMGYVGFSVAFAFAIASLLSGRLDSTYARFTRPWTLAAWIFLTLGIVLGSAWAYYELGWGGWWFWDPVENASFMPWLVGTALMHSLAVTEQRASFKAWTLLLAISAFSLCLLGTFLVRSGVLVSVHAFASDPARGMFILAFMVLVIGGSLLLFAARGHKVRSRVNNALWSRESLLLANNVLLVAAMLVVLLGTLLPLVHKQLGLGSISIGEPFFNTMFTWLMVPFALLLGVGPLVRWGRDRPRKIRNLLIIAFISTLVLSLLLPWLFESKVVAMTVLGLAMACWIAVLLIAVAVIAFFLYMRNPRRGYYLYNDDYYYYQDSDWYYYDMDGWMLADSVDEALSGDASEYYQGDSYNDYYGVEDFSDTQYYHEKDSSSDSSWDTDYSNWDSGDTDWSSDW